MTDLMKRLLAMSDPKTSDLIRGSNDKKSSMKGEFPPEVAALLL